MRCLEYFIFLHSWQFCCDSNWEMLISGQMGNYLLVMEVWSCCFYRKRRMIVQPTVTTDFQKGSHIYIQHLAWKTYSLDIFWLLRRQVMCDYIGFDISKRQRRWLGFRYGPSGHQSVAWNILNVCGTSPTVEPDRKHITVARKTSNCYFRYDQTFLILHSSMFWKYFLEIKTKAMLRKNSKLVVAQQKEPSASVCRALHHKRWHPACWKEKDDQSCCSEMPTKASISLSFHKKSVLFAGDTLKPSHGRLGSYFNDIVFLRWPMIFKLEY